MASVAGGRHSRRARRGLPSVSEVVRFRRRRGSPGPTVTGALWLVAGLVAAYVAIRLAFSY